MFCNDIFATMEEDMTWTPSLKTQINSNMSYKQRICQLCERFSGKNINMKLSQILHAIAYLALWL